MEARNIKNQNITELSILATPPPLKYISPVISEWIINTKNIEDISKLPQILIYSENKRIDLIIIEHFSL